MWYRFQLPPSTVIQLIKSIESRLLNHKQYPAQLLPVPPNLPLHYELVKQSKVDLIGVVAVLVGKYCDIVIYVFKYFGGKSVHGVD